MRFLGRTADRPSYALLRQYELRLSSRTPVTRVLLMRAQESRASFPFRQVDRLRKRTDERSRSVLRIMKYVDHDTKQAMAEPYASILGCAPE